jgi:hypothetical protein
MLRGLVTVCKGGVRTSEREAGRVTSLEALSDGLFASCSISEKLGSQQFISMLRNSALHLSRAFNHSNARRSVKTKTGACSARPLFAADAYF